jgi:hypothetical protein
MEALRKASLAGFAPALFLIAAPVFAGGFLGDFSVGLGAGFGDEKVGPGVISGRFWSNTLEVGAELFYDGDTGDEIDQFGFTWIAVRYDLTTEEGNSTYLGVGGGGLFEKNLYENDVGFMTLLGWDGKGWGLEMKYGYFDPSIYSLVVYYNF